MGECACESDIELIEAEFSPCDDCATASECKEASECKKGYSAEEDEEEDAYASFDWGEEVEEIYLVESAEKEGRKVKLNKPFRTPKGPKKFSVYVKNAKGNVVKVNFGDPNMEIKRDDPARRKAFRSRHNCSSPGPKWKARYWSCKMWSSKPVNKMTQTEDCGDCACGAGQIMYAGECVDVSTEMTIESVGASVCASTGKQVILISGIAFHEGMNKNNWSITLEGAQSIVKQMVGMDITLNHPTPTQAGFGRNMEGGIDEAVVGIITSASIEMTDGGWNVRYTAEVRRPELFEALESGLWLRSDYGVSIGGTGVPEEVNEDGTMVFGSDFEFDHLAIVHKPAYERANIEDAVKVSVSDFSKREIEANRQSFKYQTQATPNHTQTVKAMTEEEIIEETATEEAVIATDESHDDLKAQLVLANARIAEMEAIEAAKLEEARMELVAKATELGLAGHEDLPSDTLTSLIASWEASRPEPSVEMKPIASTHSGSPTPEPTPEPVVSNFLNGERLNTPESQYAKYYNLWAKAWNSTVTSSDDRALTYEETKEMI